MRRRAGSCPQRATPRASPGRATTSTWSGRGTRRERPGTPVRTDHPRRDQPPAPAAPRRGRGARSVGAVIPGGVRRGDRRWRRRGRRRAGGEDDRQGRDLRLALLRQLAALHRGGPRHAQGVRAGVRDQGQVRRGGQRQHGVLRQGAPAVRPRRLRRPRHPRRDRLDGGAHDAPRLRAAVRQGRDAERDEQPDRAPPVAALRPEAGAVDALAVWHRRNHLPQGPGEARAEERRRPVRPGLQGQGHDAHRDARHGRRRGSLTRARPGEGLGGRVHGGDRQDRRGGRFRPDPRLHGQRVHEGHHQGRLLAPDRLVRRCRAAQGRQPEHRVRRAGDRRPPVDRQHADPGRRAGRVHRAEADRLRVPARGAGRHRGVRELHLPGGGREGDPREARPGPRGEPAHLPRRGIPGGHVHLPRPRAGGGAGAGRGVPAGDRRVGPRRVGGRLKKAGLPYFLLLPGLGWLLVFFAIPLAYMAFESLKTGTLDTGYTFNWEIANYTDAIADFDEQFVRSFEYAALATGFGLLIAYPLAYVIAFRAGRWRNALLLAVIVPFFVTYLLRTISWETILADSSLVVETLRSIGILGEDGRLLDTTVAVVAGITHNHPPLLILPPYSR